MSKFRKKPVVIEAIQWVGDNIEDIQPFMENNSPGHVGRTFINHDKTLIIHTLEGDHIASVNDWIIKGVQGEFYPCKSDIFEQTYDPVD